MANNYKIINIYKSSNNMILISSIISFVLAILFFIIAKVQDKRQNIRFDGQSIQFCTNNKIEHEFDLRKIDELINYRSNTNITLGLQDSLAFRFHKNDVWQTIGPDYYDPKIKKNSIQLIKDINDTYSNLKSQRAIKQMSTLQGVRFKLLNVAIDENNMDLANEKLKVLEKTFSQYSNTYGEFDSARLVLTNESLYFNKEKIADINKGDYVRVRNIHSFNENYYTSPQLEFYTKMDELIKVIDLSFVVNTQLFKILCLSVFRSVE